MRERLKAKKTLGHLNPREQEVVESFVKELREKLGDKIVSVRLFGSKVRGNFEKDSDTDIFILVKTKKKIRDEISDIAVNYFLWYGIPLTPVVYSLFEYKRNKKFSKFLPKAKDIREGARTQMERAVEFVEEAEKTLKKWFKGLEAERFGKDA